MPVVLDYKGTSNHLKSGIVVFLNTNNVSSDTKVHKVGTVRESADGQGRNWNGKRVGTDRNRVGGDGQGSNQVSNVNLLSIRYQ
jgi:hypothetical protein